MENNLNKLVLNKLQQLESQYKTKCAVKIDEKPKFLQVERAKFVLQCGKEVVREKILKGGKDGSSSFILPILEDSGNLLLVCEPRVFTKRGVGLAIPAGYVESGEQPIKSAVRELKEETGLSYKYIKLMHKFYQDIGCSGAINYVFIAKGCTKVCEQKLDKDEYISTFECSVNDAMQLIKCGYICDAPSIIAIESYARSIDKLQRLEKGE